MRFLRRIFSLPFFPIVLSPFILFSATILSRRALFWGTPSLQFMPWWTFAWETLKNGQIPLWNPLVGMGAPLIANYQSAIFYPLNWFYLILYTLGETPAMAWGQALLVAVHLAVGGAGLALLVRRLGLGRLAQAVGGLSFSLSGYLVARAGFLSITSTVIWIPWILLACFNLATTPRYWRSIVFLALLLGLQLLAGHAQTAWHSASLAFAWVTFWAWRAGRTRKPAPDESPPAANGREGVLQAIAISWLGLILAGALAAGLAAVQLLPTGEYLGQSQRAGAVGFDFAMTYSFWPWRFLTLLSPDLFGTPMQGDYWGYGAFWEDAVYVGLLPLLMAAYAVFRAIKPVEKAAVPSGDQPSGFNVQATDRRALTLGLLTLIAVSFILALGNNTAVFPWLYRNIPGFDMFQAPTRYSIWAVTGLSILAAIGTDVWRAQQGRALYWIRLVTAGAIAVFITAILGLILLDFERESLFYGAARAGLLGVLVGLLALRAPARGAGDPAGGWAWGVAILVSADLILAGWGLNPSVPLNFYEGASPAAAQIEDKTRSGRLYLSQADEYDLKFEKFFLLDTFEPAEGWDHLRTVGLPNLNMLDGISHSANFDPLLPARYARWMELIESSSETEREALLNLSGVSLVEIPDPAAPSGVQFLPVTGDERLRWFHCSAGSQTGEDALDLISSGDVALDQVLVIEGIDVGSLRDCSRDQANLSWVEDSPNRLEVEVSSEADGWLYIADTWYPGWEAKLDGIRVDLLMANYLFRAVDVPAGDHLVELRYAPDSFRIGTLFTLLILSFLVLVLGIEVFKARRP